MNGLLPRIMFGCVGLSLLLAAPRFAAAQTTPLDPNAVPQLLKNLGADSPQIASAAARSLGVVFAPGGKGQPADLPGVVAALKQGLTAKQGASVRREAATALGLIQAKEAAEGLTAAMSDEDITVSIAAGMALAKVLPVDEARALCTKQAENASQNIQAAAVAGLSVVAKAEDAPVLAKALEISNWRLQLHAVQGLERAVKSGARIEPATYDAVAAVLGAETVDAAEAAMHFLTHVRNDECLRAAIAAADRRGDGSSNDVTWRTRTYALRTIRHLDWPATKAALPVTVRNLGDPAANVTNQARQFLNLLRKENLIDQGDLFPILAEEFAKAEPLSMRAGIMQEMGDHVPREYASAVAPRAVATLEEALKQRDVWPARAGAVKLIGLTGHTAAIETVAGCTGDDVANVRFAAGKALEQLAPLATAEQKTQVAAVLLPLLQSTVDWRKSAVAAQAAGDYAQAETLPPLAELLGHSVVNVKEGSANSLSKVARSSDAALKEQVEKLVHAQLGEGDRAWEYGAKVLGALASAKGLPLITPILQSSNWRAQANAATAVAEIAAASKTKIDDKSLTDALIKASQSDVLQVQDEANKALRAIARGEG